MTTVKEFKDLGVEMHCSDKVQWRHGNQVGVISFAWRPLNTLPDNPKFKYERDRSTQESNTMWRPLLDQSVKPSDDKPVFTQAMADAGVIPPVGSEFLHDKKVVTCLSISDYDGGVVTFAYKDREGQKEDISCCWNNDAWVKPIDNRTPKQKAIDDIVKMLHSEGVAMFDPIMLHIMYEKGFIK